MHSPIGQLMNYANQVIGQFGYDKTIHWISLTIEREMLNSIHDVLVLAHAALELQLFNVFIWTTFKIF